MPGSTATALSELTVLITGGSSAAGIAAARSLRSAGAHVVTVGSDRSRIEAAAAAAAPGTVPVVCDLADAAAVRTMAADLRKTQGRIDGVLHLVGGWRGAEGIADQSDDDWDFLERNIIATLRNVGRAFYADLEASPSGRLAIVSSSAVTAPRAAAADYAAAKAAAETWVFAVADGFRRAQPGNPHSAAVVLAVKALVDEDMRRKNPERTFPGFTDVADLAGALTGLFTRPAAELNGTRLVL